MLASLLLRRRRDHGVAQSDTRRDTQRVILSRIVPVCHDCGSPTPGKRLSVRLRFLGYQPFDELPAGINLNGNLQPADQVRFLCDQT